MKIDTSVIERLRDGLLEKGRRPSLVLSSAYEELTRQGLLSPEETAALERIDPVAEAMYLMMAADGNLAKEERDVFRGAIRDLTNCTLRSGTIKVLLQSHAKKAKEVGWQARLEEVASELAKSPGDAETAYGLVAAIALADEEVTLEENELIDRFAELLGISDDRCCELLDMVKTEVSPPWEDEIEGDEHK